MQASILKWHFVRVVPTIMPSHRVRGHSASLNFDYKSKEKKFFLQVGGGWEIKFQTLLEYMIRVETSKTIFFTE